MKVAYRVSYLVCILSSRLAAWLARDFRALTRAHGRWGPLVVPLQVPLFVAWCPARAVSLGSFAVCQNLAARLD